MLVIGYRFGGRVSVIGGRSVQNAGACLRSPLGAERCKNNTLRSRNTLVTGINVRKNEIITEKVK